MDERIGMMLTVLHAENKFILKTIVKLMCKSDTAKKYIEDVTKTFDEAFSDAAKGKLSDD